MTKPTRAALNALAARYCRGETPSHLHHQTWSAIYGYTHLGKMTTEGLTLIAEHPMVKRHHEALEAGWEAASGWYYKGLFGRTVSRGAIYKRGGEEMAIRLDASCHHYQDDDGYWTGKHLSKHEAFNAEPFVSI